MINLIDLATRSDLRAARRNVYLRRALVMLIGIALIMTACYGIGYLILANQAEAYRQEVARYAPEKEKYNDVIKAANSYSSNLKIAKTILQNEFLYSNLLIVFARTLPPNTVLDGINITSADLSKPIELTINAASYSDADQIKKTFQASPYFKDTKLRSVTKLTQGDRPYATQLITTLNVQSINDAQQEGKL